MIRSGALKDVGTPHHDEEEELSLCWQTALLILLLLNCSGGVSGKYISLVAVAVGHDS